MTPLLQHAQRQFAADLAAGGTRAAVARGKQVIGAMMYAQAVNLATSGRITGGGPADPEARHALLATGWQPYSIVSVNPDGTKTFTSYARVDQVAMFFGLTADFTEAAGHMSTSAAEDTAAAMVTALSHNLTSKTYLGGLVDALDALRDPDHKMLKVFQSFSGSFIPNTRQFTDIRPETQDPYMREAWGILDGIRKKLPGFSKDLPPVRNVYGDAIHVPAGFGPDTISPFYVSESVEDPLLTELAKFSKGFSMPSKRVGNVDLTSIPSKEGGWDSYDRLLQLNGSVRIGGKNLKERLAAFVASDSYRKLTEDGPGYSGSKFEAIGQIIGQHRTAALESLRKENPVVKAAMTQDRTNKARALNKGPDGIVDLQGFIDQFQKP